MRSSLPLFRSLSAPRMTRPRLRAVAVGAGLVCLCALLLLTDMLKTQQQPEPGASQEPLIASSSELDDPLGFWQLLQPQQQHSNGTAAAATAAAAGSKVTVTSARDAGAGVLCSNTCTKARDGVCDEGRRGNLSLAGGINWVHCDLGTDCDDCGPWRGVQAGPAWSESVGPIAYLKLYNIDVRAKQVPVTPRFVFAFTDPAVDQDQSAHMKNNGVVEGGISQVFHKVLGKACSAAQPGSAGFVVDVGANFGWFSLLSAALGCSVLAVEPVPIFRAFLEYSAARNHLTPIIELIPAVVAPDVAKTYTINAPLVTGAQWGASGMDVPNHPGTMQIPARAVRLDDLAFGDSSSSSSSSSGSVVDAGGGGSRRSLQQAGSGTSSDARQPRISVSSTSGHSSGGSSMAAAGSTAARNITSTPRQQQQQQQQQQQTKHQTKQTPEQPVSGQRSRFMTAKLGAAVGASSAAGAIDLLKVDVEGREPDVFATATRLLDSRAVANVVMEYSPGYWYQTTDRTLQMEALPLLLLNLLNRNFSMVHIPWNIAHDARGPLAAGHWDVPLPVMDAVTKPQLAYDLWTAQRIRNGTLPGQYGPGSLPCREMAASGMAFAEPGFERFALHAAFHPKSFAANFVFNTNVWATRDKALLGPPGPGTGLFNDREAFPFYYKSDQKWFPQGALSDTHAFGMPWAFCEHVPPKHQVAMRCRCRAWDVCGQHQVAVQQCVAKKQTGYTNIDDALLGRMLADAAAKIKAQDLAAAAPGRQQQQQQQGSA